MSHGGFPMTASNPAAGSRSPPAPKKISGNSSSQWKKRRAPATSAARVRYRCARCAGKSLRSCRTASASAPNADAGGASAPMNHWAHQRSAVRFHRASAESGRSSPASARSFARTCSTVSFGPASANRTGRALCAADWKSSPNSDGRGVHIPPPQPDGRSRQARQPGADQAVAHPDAMVQERQRPVPGESRQPEREPRELNGHRIQIHAEQAALRDLPPYRRPFLGTDVIGETSAGREQRFFVRFREKPAGGDEKGAAAHGRIQHRQLQNLVRAAAAHEGTNRLPDEIVRDGLRRVEGARRLAGAGSPFQRDGFAPPARGG